MARTRWRGRGEGLQTASAPADTGWASLANGQVAQLARQTSTQQELPVDDDSATHARPESEDDHTTALLGRPRLSRCAGIAVVLDYTDNPRRGQARHFRSRSRAPRLAPKMSRSRSGESQPATATPTATSRPRGPGHFPAILDSGDQIIDQFAGAPSPCSDQVR